MSNRLDKQTAISVERDLSSVHSALVNISNRLYEAAVDHPFLDELQSVISDMEFLPTETLHEEYEPTGATE